MSKRTCRLSWLSSSSSLSDELSLKYSSTSPFICDRIDTRVVLPTSLKRKITKIVSAHEVPKPTALSMFFYEFSPAAALWQSIHPYFLLIEPKPLHIFTCTDQSKFLHSYYFVCALKDQQHCNMLTSIWYIFTAVELWQSICGHFVPIEPSSQSHVFICTS